MSSALHATRGADRLNSDWSHIAIKPLETLTGVLCNTPGKRNFSTKKAAEAHIKTLRKPAESYSCQCGSYHVRSKSGRRR